jgi:hypothetical protein
LNGVWAAQEAHGQQHQVGLDDLQKNWAGQGGRALGICGQECSQTEWQMVKAAHMFPVEFPCGVFLGSWVQREDLMKMSGMAL